MIRNVLIVLNFVLLVALAGYVLLKNDSRRAYVHNQRLFEGFKGKQELEQQLGHVRLINKQKLDSLSALIEADKRNSNLIPVYRNMLEAAQLQEEELSQKYTADIWKRINQYVAAYGKESGYDFIFGATGDGGLMYAGSEHDITDDVVRYVNRRYEQGTE